jgi:hypothetical protein
MLYITTKNAFSFLNVTNVTFCPTTSQEGRDPEERNRRACHVVVQISFDKAFLNEDGLLFCYAFDKLVAI